MKDLFEKFCTGLVTGLIKDLVGSLNQSNLSTLIFQLLDHQHQKYFLWCHVKHINPIEIHPAWIMQKDKEFIKDVNYDGIEFPVSEENFSKLETKNNICINVFLMKIN